MAQRRISRRCRVENMVKGKTWGRRRISSSRGKGENLWQKEDQQYKAE